MYKSKYIRIIILILLSSLIFLTGCSKKTMVYFDGTTFVLDNYDRKNNTKIFISIDDNRRITVKEQEYNYLVIDGKKNI
jgi:uncharacterized lipoprotein YajG